jgi:hypothetical protein
MGVPGPTRVRISFLAAVSKIRLLSGRQIGLRPDHHRLSDGKVT